MLSSFFSECELLLNIAVSVCVRCLSVRLSSRSSRHLQAPKLRLRAASFWEPRYEAQHRLALTCNDWRQQLIKIPIFPFDKIIFKMWNIAETNSFIVSRDSVTSTRDSDSVIDCLLSTTLHGKSWQRHHQGRNTKGWKLWSHYDIVLSANTVDLTTVTRCERQTTFTGGLSCRRTAADR